MGSSAVQHDRVLWTRLTSIVSGLRCKATLISQPLLLQLTVGAKAAIAAYQKSDVIGGSTPLLHDNVGPPCWATITRA